MIYLDNAASSWPKPAEVASVMQEMVINNGANPGRGGHKMAVEASRILFNTRCNIAQLFNISNPNDIVFTLNTTHALNLAINGYVRDGDHVISTAIEHNSVRRPLEYLKQHKGVEVSYITANEAGECDLEQLESLIKTNTKLLVCTHSSNLTGTIVPLERMKEILEPHDIALCVDAAQTAGTFPIDVEKLGIDMLAFPGHKGLLGPQGTGGLYIHPTIDLDPLLLGGTGSQSELIEQPTVRPDRYESGTQNTIGIAGLNEGVKFVNKTTVDRIHRHEFHLTQRLMTGLMDIEGVNILGVPLGVDKTGITSFNLNNQDSAEVAYILDQHYNIAVRAGYHCTPLSHEVAGTLDVGAVRASVSTYTTEEEIDAMIQAIKEIQTKLISR